VNAGAAKAGAAKAGSSRGRAARRAYDLVPIVRHERRTLALGPSGRLRLAVVADTHGRPHPDAARHLGALAPDAILHAGDVGDPAVLADLRAIAPVLAVRGNIDAVDGELPDAMTIAITAGGVPISAVLLVHIAVSGPRLRADAARLAAAEAANVVVCGHSHVPFLARDRGLVVFNPGSIGPRRFQLPIVFGVIDVATTGIAIHHVDCETGRPWSPP
jgi:putative phosphoesterase